MENRRVCQEKELRSAVVRMERGGRKKRSRKQPNPSHALPGYRMNYQRTAVQFRRFCRYGYRKNRLIIRPAVRNAPQKRGDTND